MTQDVARLWTAEPGRLDAREAAPTYLEILSPDERTRMGRYRRPRDRNLFLHAHGLLRTALSACAPEVHPAAWTFARTEHGRPEVRGPRRRDLRFNISHTDGLVACLVVPDVDCGLDVERIDRRLDVTTVCRALSAVERADVLALPDHARHARFHRYWTLKEAYAKARGLGLSFPTDRCVFDLRARPITVALSAGLGDSADDWQFAQWQATDQHVLAVALRRGAGPELQILHQPDVSGTARRSSAL